MTTRLTTEEAIAEMKRAKAEAEAGKTERHYMIGGLRIVDPPAAPTRPADTPRVEAPQIPSLARQVKIIRGRELMGKQYAPMIWAVDGLISEGLNILAGAPKSGKSWLALDIATAITTGKQALGHFRCSKGTVLYLALEDSERRVTERIETLGMKDDLNDNFVLCTECPRADNGGIEFLGNFVNDNPDTRLIIIDVLQRFRTMSRAGVNLYEAQYAELEQIQRFAISKGLAVLALTHKRKGTRNGSGDPFDEITGSTAIRGAADVNLVLSKSRNLESGAVLKIEGRDLPPENEQDIALRKAGARWIYAGTAEEADISETRHKIIEAMKEGYSTPKEIGQFVEVSTNTIYQRLANMQESGIIQKTGHGRYVLTGKAISEM